MGQWICVCTRHIMKCKYWLGVIRTLPQREREQTLDTHC